MGRLQGFKEDWQHATPFLFFCVGIFACGDLVFGIDTSTFGSLQALPSWLNTFGTDVKGVKAITTYEKAIMNSIIYIGRLVGCTTFEPVAERLGYRKILFIAALLQIIAVIVQLTSKTWQVFTIGRVIAYVAVGYIENTVPTYSAEIAPAPLRGFCSGLLTPAITLSSVWGAGMCQAYATETRKIGWMMPIGVQAIPAVMILALVWFSVESPRWLVSHGRKADALMALKRLRRKQDAINGVCEAEIDALDEAIEYDREVSTARWRDLLGKTYLRRSIYCGLLFWFYQTTGNSFYNAYGPSFFKQIGLGAKSFEYAVLVQSVGAIGAFMAIGLTDRIGRRPLIITGATLLILFDCLIAGLGGSSTHTTTSNNVVVASFVLMLWSEKISWATHCYMIGSELGGVRMRKKIMMVGTTVDLFAGWLVGFTSPYIMNAPYGNIGGKIGYIFAGMSVLSLIFAVLWVPELRGRSLEEVDELFEKPLWGWQFAGVKTTGVGAAIAELEGGHLVDEKAKAAAHQEYGGEQEDADPIKGTVSHHEVA